LTTLDSQGVSWSEKGLETHPLGWITICGYSILKNLILLVLGKVTLIFNLHFDIDSYSILTTLQIKKNFIFIKHPQEFISLEKTIRGKFQVFGNVIIILATVAAETKLNTLISLSQAEDSHLISSNLGVQRVKEMKLAQVSLAIVFGKILVLVQIS
jgi:hypothetical protein